jgi:hypothetical protein
MYEARGFEGTGISGPELDKYITGNFGADQYDNEEAIEYGWNLALEEAEYICYDENLDCDHAVFTICPVCGGPEENLQSHICSECHGLGEVFYTCDIGCDYENCPRVQKAALLYSEKYSQNDTRESWED